MDLFIPKSVRNILKSYYENRPLKKHFVKFFLLITQYKIKEEVCSKGGILILYASDRVPRLDHIDSMRLIESKLNYTPDSASFVSICRVIKFDIRFIVRNIFCDIEKIYISQVLDIGNSIKLETYQSLLVHCDTVPIQSYFVHLANELSLETYSLQHGFYPKPETSAQWMAEYTNSISKNLFVWNVETEEYFSHYSPIRNYIKSGPFASRIIKISNSKKKKNFFFTPSKYDHEMTLFLIQFSKKYDSQEKYFVCHPNYNLIDKIKLYLKTGVRVLHSIENDTINSNSTCYCINSSVWVDLHLNDISYIVLDDYYSSQSILLEKDIESCTDRYYNDSLYYIGDDALDIIVGELHASIH
jgi:hypothetical protein